MIDEGRKQKGKEKGPDGIEGGIDEVYLPHPFPPSDALGEDYIEGIVVSHIRKSIYAIRDKENKNEK